MKIKVFDRVLLALYALLGLAALAYAALNMLLPGTFPPLIRLGDSLSQSPMWIAAAVAAGVVFLAWTARLLTVAFTREPRFDRGSVSVQNTENGAVRVSVAAMDALVKQAIGQSEGVVDIKTRIVNHEDSITVKIEMTLAADAHIPNVTMLMQRNIKSFIEEFSGIAVREVEIMVTSIQQVERPVPALTDHMAGHPPKPPVNRPEPTIYAAGPIYEPESPVSEPAQPQPAAELDVAQPDFEAEAPRPTEDEILEPSERADLRSADWPDPDAVRPESDEDEETSETPRQP